jgi:hypothetical protein
VSPAKPKIEKLPKPPKPWTRAEAGRYRSADERFTLESDGTGRWFLTDAEELDELGLARTTGPFPTLDAAKAAADEVRERPAPTSPLAERIAGATSKGSPKASAKPAERSVGRREPAGDEPTWLEELADRDADLARRATRLVASLEREGIADADAVVRRDVLGDRPAIATRLLARDVLAAIAALRNPSAADLAAAVAGVLATSPKHGGLPGWELRERDSPGGRDRPIRLTASDLEDAADAR